jgi:hypothetical protein
MIFTKNLMGFIISLCIVLLVGAVFLSNGMHSYAQIPVPIENNFSQERITSPIPQADSSTNYYPDPQLPANITSMLLISGLILMLVGIELINDGALRLFFPKRKNTLILQSKHFGHNI